MQKFILEFFRNHFAIILCILCVGFIHVSPFLYFQNEAGSSYKGFFLGGSYDEEFYWSLVNQVKDQKSVDGNMYIFEQADSGISFRYHPIEFVLGQIERILPIDKLAVATKFFFPALLTLVSYLMFSAFGLSRLGAIVGSFAVLLGNELAPLAFNQILKTITLEGGPHSFLYYDRPVNPAVSAPIFFGLITLIYLFFTRPTFLKSVLVGVGVGLMAYIYFFYWNYLLILFGLIIIVAIISKRWDLFKHTLSALFISLIVSSPFIFGVLQTFLFPDLDLLTVAKNYISTHRFILEKIVLFPLIIVSLLLLFDRKKQHTLINSNERQSLFFVLLMLFSGFIASNQQVITGMEIQQFHYHFSTNIPAFLITMSLLFGLILSRIPKTFQYLGTFSVIGIFIIHAIFIQINSYRYNFNETLDSQRYISGFEWLNKNTTSNDVVFSDVRLSELLPVYTRNYVYGALHASAFPVPTERLKHNYYTTIAIDGVSTDEAKNHFYDPVNRNSLGQYIFEGQYWRAKCGSFGCFPDQTLDELVSDYKKFLDNPLRDNLKKYRIDYVFWDLKNDPTWKLDQYLFLEKVFSENEVAIYKVR